MAVPDRDQQDAALDEEEDGCGDPYDGPLLDMRPLELGAMEQDEVRHYTFKVSWPARNDSPDLSETSASFTFDWRLDSLP